MKYKGKKFRFLKGASSKANAEKVAVQYRKKGYYARIEKTGNKVGTRKYMIYIAKK